MQNKTGLFLQYGGILFCFLLAGPVIDSIRAKKGVTFSFEGIPFLNNVSVDSQKKSGMVVYFWATWCKVCESNLPIININKDIAGRLKIPFYSIEEGEDTGKLQKYVKDHEISFPVGIGNPSLLKSLSIEGFPTTVFIDSNGEIVFQDTGMINPFSFLIRLLFL